MTSEHREPSHAVLGEFNQLLAEAGRILSSWLDLGDTLDELSRLVVPRLADWYVVHLIAPSGEIVPIRIAHVDPAKVDLAWEVMRRWPTRPDEPIGAARSVRTGEPSLRSNIDRDLLAQLAQDDEHFRLLEELDLHSGMVVPLVVRHRTIGALTFVHAESRRTYGPDDLAVAQELADLAALAIDSAQLFAEAEAARRTAERAAERLSILARASAALAASLDPDTTLQQLARFTIPSLADYAVAYALDANGTIRRVGFAHADPLALPLLEELETIAPPNLGDQHGAGAVLRTAVPMLAERVSPELDELAPRSEARAAILRRLGTRSVIVVPLGARGRTSGALLIARTERSGERYTREDLALADELAGRAALLVDNARLYRKAQRAIRDRDELLAIVSHDLRNPLSTVVTACELLATGPPGERQQRCHDSISRAAKQMTRLLDDLLDVAQIEEGRLSLHLGDASLADVIAEVGSIFAPIAEEKSIRLRTSARGTGNVRCDRDRLVQALSNLIGNAIKFSPPGGEVTVRAAPDPAGTRIAVRDEGPGIAPADLPHIFERFYRGNRTTPSGVGLGLAIAQGIVAAHHGRIEVRSDVGAGTELAIVLPADHARSARTGASAHRTRGEA